MTMPTIEDVNKLVDRSRRLMKASDKFEGKKQSRIKTIGDDNWMDYKEACLYDYVSTRLLQLSVINSRRANDMLVKIHETPRESAV